MRVVLLAEAEAELYDAAAWYDERHAGLGHELVRAVYQALDVICEAPHAWPRWPAAPGRIPPIRRFLLTRFPYAIACQAHERVITVLAVVHGKRRPFYWVGRQT